MKEKKEEMYLSENALETMSFEEPIKKVKIISFAAKTS